MATIRPVIYFRCYVSMSCEIYSSSFHVVLNLEALILSSPTRHLLLLCLLTFNITLFSASFQLHLDYSVVFFGFYLFASPGMIPINIYLPPSLLQPHSGSRRWSGCVPFITDTQLKLCLKRGQRSEFSPSPRCIEVISRQFSFV